MPPSAVTLKLLHQLMKGLSRQDKSFDRYKIAFLKKLQNSASDSESEALCKECIEQLNDFLPIDDTLSEGRLLASQSQIQLQKLPHLSDKINSQIEDAKSISQPYTIIEHHLELENIIKIYQRVVIELNKTNTQENKVASDASGPLVESLCDELQEVILHLDVGTPYIKKLELIRKKISNETDPLALPEYCLAIISIIIDSTREERRSSRHFLYTLNDSLTQFYLNFSTNIKTAESAFVKQEACVKSIQKQSSALQKATANCDDIISIQKFIFDYVENVEAMVQNRESQKEQEVRQQFRSMARQIKELQNETNNYQHTLKQQNKQLHIDFLTKIPNRAAWSERLQIEFTRYQRYKQQLNIAVIDIDKFKVINDTFGHLAGDKVLNVIAQTLQKSIRNTDFIARFGGEEFALLLPEISKEQCEITLNKLCQVIKRIPFKFKKQDISITISVGATIFSENDTIESAFERADQALYNAKNTGRDQVICTDN